jgi:hypothetical protein
MDNSNYQMMFFSDKKFTPRRGDGVDSLDDRIGIERHLRKCPIRKLKEPF